MELYWKDKYDDKGNWAYLEFQVNSTDKPQILLKSGINKKFRLENLKDILFWGKVESEWYGAWFLRNENDWEVNKMIIPPINSNEIESKKINNFSEKFSQWSKYFALNLEQSNNSLLFKEKWRLSIANSDIQYTKSIPEWKIIKPENTFNYQNPYWIDWGGTGGIGELLALKRKPNENNGRVKWYRKLVKQDKCPPILAWFVNSLDAYIILDGHCRLKAFIDEEVKPEILVLATLREIEDKPDLQKQMNIKQAMSDRSNKITIDKVNKLLIEAFDDRPISVTYTKSKGSYNFSESWDEQVKIFYNKPDVDLEELDAMYSE